jgi:hypothetical protein
MKIILKCLYVISVAFLLIIGCFVDANAQTESKTTVNSAATNDSLKARIINLEKIITDGSYTRIPNKDFDTIIDNKIESAMRETVKWWLFVIAALISLLGFLINKYAKVYLQNIVDAKINLLKKENEEKIKSISIQYFSSVIDSLIDFKIEIITKKNYRVEETVVDDLRNYLTDETITIAKQKKVYLIDTIMTCYYENNYQDKTKKMIDLIKKYEEKFTLLPETYANAAIAFLNRYQLYGAKEFLNSTLENCDKSIKALPDYGLAFALKIELYIMAISKAFDAAEKKQFENELLKVFKDIDNNISIYLCNELIKRFEIDKKNLGTYLEKLYKEYPDEMAKIENRMAAAQTDKPPATSITSEEPPVT